MTDETPEPESGSLVAAGGWCAPSTTLYTMTSTEDTILFPEFRLLTPGTPEWDEHQARLDARDRARREALAALPPTPEPVGQVWVAYRDLSYEGDETVAITASALGALAACERHSLAEHRGGPITWDTDHPEDGYLDGWAGGDRYYVTRQDLQP